eukprot:3209934-Pleurochrysis_carterae.AAC.1
MLGIDPNHLAHQQLHVVMRRAAGFRSQPSESHSPKSVSKPLRWSTSKNTLLAVDSGAIPCAVGRRR